MNRGGGGGGRGREPRRNSRTGMGAKWRTYDKSLRGDGAREFSC